MCLGGSRLSGAAPFPPPLDPSVLQKLHSKLKPRTSHIPTLPSKATGSIYAPLVSALAVAVFVHFYGWHLVYVGGCRVHSKGNEVVLN